MRSARLKRTGWVLGIVWLTLTFSARAAWTQNPGIRIPRAAGSALDSATWASSSVVRQSVRDWVGRPPTERHPRVWHSKKNPRLAMVSSFLFPGLGQLYNEREFWALVAAGVHFFYIGNIIVEARQENRFRRIKNAEPDNEDAQILFILHRDNRVQNTWLLALTMLLSGAQAFVDAHLFDFQHSSPLQFEPEMGSIHGGALRLHF